MASVICVPGNNEAILLEVGAKVSAKFQGPPVGYYEAEIVDILECVEYEVSFEDNPKKKVKVGAEKVQFFIKDPGKKVHSLKRKVSAQGKRIPQTQAQVSEWEAKVETLSEWLSDTEELVANQLQRPPSSQLKIIEAQLQEQKLLKRLVDDKKPTVDSLKQEAKQLSSIADPGDRRNIQQQLTDLFQRWDALTINTTDRKQKLEDILEAAKDFKDAFDPLVEWVEATERKLSSQQPITTDPAKMEADTTEHQAITRDIADHREAVEDAVETGKSLLAQTTGDDVHVIQERLDILEDRYANISSTANGRQQRLQQALPLARKFKDATEKLSDWLDKVEADMGTAEVAAGSEQELERFRVITKDITDHRAAVEDAVETGNSLLTQATGDDVHVIQERLDILEDRYANISSTANGRQQRLQQALPLARKFKDATEKLSDWLDKVEADMGTAEVAAGSEQEQEIFREYKKQVDGHKHLVANMNEAGAKVMELSPGEGARSVEHKIANINQRYDSVIAALSGKNGDSLNVLAQQEEEGLTQTQAQVSEWEAKVETLSEWLSDTEELVANQLQRPPSSQLKIIEAQLQEQKLLKRLVDDKKPTVDSLKQEAKQLSSIADPGDRRNIQQQLTDLFQRWDALTINTTDRKQKLEDILEAAKDFKDAFDPLVEWVEATERKLSSQQPITTDPAKMEADTTEHQVITKDITDHRAAVEDAVETGKSLLTQATGDDVHVIQERLDILEDRYANISSTANGRQQRLQQALPLARKFKDATEKLSDWLDKVEADMGTAEVAAGSEQELERFRVITKDITDHRAAVEDAVETGNSLLTQATGDDVHVIQERLGILEDRYANISSTANGRQQRLQQALPLARKFKDATEKLSDWLDKVEADMGTAEVAAGSEQEQEIFREYKKQVDGHKHLVANMNEAGAKVMELSPGEGTRSVEHKIANINQRYDSVIAAVQHRLEVIQAHCADIKDTTNREDQHAHIEPLQTQVDTSGLMADLEAVNDRWNSLASKVSEWEAKMETLSEWLSDTEELVTNQRPPSSQLKIIEAQLQEQKLLKRLVDDKKPKVDSLKQEAKQLSSIADPGDRRNIQQQLTDLFQRWDALTINTADRKQKLEDILEAAKDFKDAFDPLVEWVEATERKLSSQQPITTDPAKMEADTTEHQVITKDITDHRAAVEDAVETGKSLLTQATGDDVHVIQERLDILEDRYANISSTANGRQQRLQQALPLARKFKDATEKLSDWLDKVEADMATAEDAAMSEQEQEIFREYKKQVDEHKHLVANMNEAGAKVMELSPGEGARSVEHKIANINQRYDSVIAALSGKNEDSLNVSAEQEEEGLPQTQAQQLQEVIAQLRREVEDLRRLPELPRKLEDMSQDEMRTYVGILVRNVLRRPFKWKEEEKPPFWPCDIPFSSRRPSGNTTNWSDKMRIVIKAAFTYYDQKPVITRGMNN
ncbi:microtubule-actin cross-linking factor 1, isoforms 6/7-like isoform X3 [Branchiostoma floridae x Branchiostoma japonicum]